MIVFSHPTHNANVRQAGCALVEAGLLSEFWTCLAWDQSSPFNRFIPTHIQAQLRRRALPTGLQDLTKVKPIRELARHFCSRSGLSWFARHEMGMFSIDAVYRSLDQTVARSVEKAKGLRAVYCYEDGAAATFEAARKRGLRCIYDLPIGYWRAAHTIYEEERIREPEWQATLTGILDSPEKLARKDRELEAADLVVVASSFTRQTLQLAPFPCRAIAVIPYGSPLNEKEPDVRDHGGPLRILFAGALGQRKGLSYLLEAVTMLGKRVELTLLGRKTVETCVLLNTAVRKVRWVPSLPHSEVLEEMGRHDMLVCPSLFEGFGLVILEAMSRGLPVITTPNTAGPDVIRDGQDGYIVPIRSAEAIATRLDEVASDSGKLSAMKHAAFLAAKTYTWQNYRDKLAWTVRNCLKESEMVPAGTY